MAPSDFVHTIELIHVFAVDAAYALFCEAGYNATTMDAIAQRAGVAVQTLYFTFHTKDALLQQVHDRTVLGEEALPPQVQPWYRAATAEPDLRQAIRLIVEGVEPIFARVAPMLGVFHTVAGEPAGQVWRQGEALRLAGYDTLITTLEGKSRLRRGVTHDDARDILFVVLSPEIYQAFVHGRGWTAPRWIDWTVTTLLRDLFASDAPARATRTRPRASAP